MNTRAGMTLDARARRKIEKHVQKKRAAAGGNGDSVQSTHPTAGKREDLRVTNRLRTGLYRIEYIPTVDDGATHEGPTFHSTPQVHSAPPTGAPGLKDGTNREKQTSLSTTKVKSSPPTILPQRADNAIRE